uniref:Uncharacterized protein n=1 Tax=Oryza nivara TaxID=4536 RepID=A0A0E0IWF0_ORYNI
MGHFMISTGSRAGSSRNSSIYYLVALIEALIQEAVFSLSHSAAAQRRGFTGGESARLPRRLLSGGALAPASSSPSDKIMLWSLTSHDRSELVKQSIYSPECGRLCRPELCGPVLHWACGEEEQIDPVQLLLLGEDEVVTEPLQAIGWDRHGHLLLQRKSEELCDVILDPLQQLPIHPMVHKLQVLHISEDY